MLTENPLTLKANAPVSYATPAALPPKTGTKEFKGPVCWRVPELLKVQFPVPNIDGFQVSVY